MEDLIKNVIELDKKMRQKVQNLEDEKSNLGAFFREERKKLEEKYSIDADKQLKEKTAALKKEEVKIKADINKKYKATMEQIESNYNESKEKWTKKIYEYCIGKSQED